MFVSIISVMAGLDPAIQVLAARRKNVDARDKRGHDDVETSVISPRAIPRRTSASRSAGSRRRRRGRRSRAAAG
ncbi:hypothetical protein CV770_12215 [Bradyrhizobium sp. AC87j1]|nr:hypothetical protein CV770_12215 [Bradyrhizobium sp. AC87j1]